MTNQIKNIKKIGRFFKKLEIDLVMQRSSIVYDSVLPGILNAYTNQKIENDKHETEMFHEILQSQSSKFNFRQQKEISKDAFMEYDSCIVRSFFDPCCYYDNYISGCGGPYFDWSDWSSRTIECELLYFNKNGDEGGEPVAEDCEDLLSSVEEFAGMLEKVSIFPNPFSNELTVSCEDNYCLISHIKLFDIRGNLLIKKELLDGKTTITTNRLSVGVYILEIRFEDGKIIREKVIKN